MEGSLARRKQLFFDALAEIEATVKAVNPDFNDGELANEVGRILTEKLNSGEIVEP